MVAGPLQVAPLGGDASEGIDRDNDSVCPDDPPCSCMSEI